MLKRLVRIGARVACVVAAAWIARWALKRWVDGPDAQPSSKPWPPVDGAGTPGGISETASSASTISVRASEAASRPSPTPPAGATWVKADDIGAAPTSHPVKAKVKSGLYHLPGMAAYARTHPDRCYPTPEAAEEDGFKPAKR